MTDPRKFAPWVADAVTPDPHEVERIEGALPADVAAAAGRATSPTDVETSRLVARLTAVAPSRRKTPTWALAPVAAMVIAGIWIGAREGSSPTEEATSTSRPVTTVVAELPGPVPPATHRVPLQPALGAPTSLQADMTMRAGPSVTLVGAAEVTLIRLTEMGPEIELRSGGIDITVDPEGEQRALSVAAGDVRVSVVGTVFRMERDGDDVTVSVRRGRVRVEHRGATLELGAGESWTRPTPVAFVIPAPAPEPSRLEEAPAPESVPPKPEISSPTPSEPPSEATPEESPAESPAEVLNAIMTASDQGESPARQRVRLDDFLKRFPDSNLVGVAEELLEELDDADLD